MGQRRNSHRWAANDDHRQRDRDAPAAGISGQPPAPASGAVTARPVVLGVSALLLLAVGLAFGQTVRFGFVNIDDDKYVYNTPQISGGLSAASVVWAFTHCHSENWHPLTWLSLMLDCQLYGLGGGGHHLTNVLLHAATAVLLFLVLRQMTGRLWPSALAAAVFAIHPLRAESVAWVTERKDVLSGLCFMLTLGAYVNYARRASRGWYLATLVLFALGLMAKPMLVTLPLLLLLLDYWPLGRFETGADGVAVPQAARRLIIEKLPLFALAILSCLATILAQQEAIVSENLIPLWARVANALVAYVAYLGQFLWPQGLSLFYPHPGTHLPIWKIVEAGVMLAGISAVVFTHRRRPYLLVGWLWYLGMLVPAVGLMQVAGQAMADRYTYLPEIGLTIGMIWWAADSSAAWPYRRPVWAAASAAALAVLLGGAWRQTSFWCDSDTLWNRTLACTSDNKVAHNNLAAALAAAGRLDEAAVHYRQSLQINPRDARGLLGLGFVLARLNRADEALACYRKALEIKPGDAIAHYNLASLLAEQGRLAEALPEYEQALAVRPAFAKAHRDLAVALAAGGRPAEAMEHFRRALELNPSDAESHCRLGDLLAVRGQPAEAMNHYRQALAIQPGDDAAHSHLGAALANGGRLGEAVEQFEEAEKIQPDDARTHAGLAKALAARGRFAEAIRQYRLALKLQPDDLDTQKELAWLWATCPEAPLRRGVEAVALAQRASAHCDGKRPDVLDALAAAYAEARWFPEAVAAARKARELAARENDRTLAAAVQARLALYEAGKPYHQPSLPPHGSGKK
jgi:tetratricopeptide (TPR) repeat protein